MCEVAGVESGGQVDKARLMDERLRGGAGSEYDAGAAVEGVANVWRIRERSGRVFEVGKVVQCGSGIVVVGRMSRVGSFVTVGLLDACMRKLPAMMLHVDDLAEISYE